MFTSWFLAGLLAMTGFAVMTLTLKFATAEVGSNLILFYLAGFVTIYSAIAQARSAEGFQITPKMLCVVAFAGLCSFFASYGDFEAIRLAPNTGYSAALKGGQIAIVTTVATLFFQGQHLTVGGIAGVLMVMGGIVLLAMQQA